MFQKPAMDVRSGGSRMSSLSDFSSFISRTEAEEIRENMSKLMARITNQESVLMARLANQESLISTLCDKISQLDEQSQSHMIRSAQLQHQLSTGVAFSPKAYAEYLSSKVFKTMVFAAVYSEAPYMCQVR